MASKKKEFGEAEERMELITREPPPEAERIRSFADHNHDRCEKLINKRSPERKLELKK